MAGPPTADDFSIALMVMRHVSTKLNARARYANEQARDLRSKGDIGTADHMAAGARTAEREANDLDDAIRILEVHANG